MTDAVGDISTADSAWFSTDGAEFAAFLFGGGTNGTAAPGMATEGAPGGAAPGATSQTILFGREPGDTSDISPNDIHQSGIGDCYLDSTMGEMALKNPSALRNMIHDNGDGTYTVTLHRQDNGLTNLWGLFGNRYTDDKITVRPDVPANAINTQTPDPVQVNGKHEIWPQLIEKAYAQQQGGYNNIGHGGWPSTAMESLTGRDAGETSATHYSGQQLQSDFNAGKLIVLDTNNIGARDANPLGLVGPHAYMVTAVSNTPQGAMVTLQNPWGNGTSGGAWATRTVPYAQLQPYLTNVSVGTTH